VRTIQYGSDNLFQITLTDQATNTLEDGATVVGTLYTASGTSLATFDFTGLGGGSGVYQGILPAADCALPDSVGYRVKIVATSGGSTMEVDDQAIVVLDVSDSTSFIDWQSPFLAKQNYQATDAGRVQSLARMATRSIQQYCHRDFFQAEYDELYKVGQENKVFFRQYPVQSLVRFCDNQQIFLTIQNTDSSVTSATVAVQPGALVLNWMSNGTTYTSTLAFASDDEGDMATAINAVGHGWVANNNTTVEANSVGDLVLGQFGSAKQPFNLIGWLDSASPLQLYFSAGYVQLSHQPPSQSWLSSSYWPLAMPQLNEQVRAVYVAGYEPWNIPADLQFVCAELVRLTDSGNMVIQTENLGSYSYTTAMGMDALGRLPITTKRILESYKDRKWSGMYLGA